MTEQSIEQKSEKRRKWGAIWSAVSGVGAVSIALTLALDGHGNSAPLPPQIAPTNNRIYECDNESFTSQITTLSARNVQQVANGGKPTRQPLGPGQLAWRDFIEDVKVMSTLRDTKVLIDERIFLNNIDAKKEVSNYFALIERGLAKAGIRETLFGDQESNLTAYNYAQNGDVVLSEIVLQRHCHTKLVVPSPTPQKLMPASLA